MTPRPPLAREVAVAVGADGGEERVGERELPGGAGEDRQADRADRRRHREQAGLQPERLEVEREQQRDDPQHDAHEPAGPAQASAGAQTRVSSRVPNRPAGRTSSTSTITTYGRDLAEPAAEERDLVLVARRHRDHDADDRARRRPRRDRVEPAEDGGRERAQRREPGRAVDARRRERGQEDRADRGQRAGDEPRAGGHAPEPDAHQRGGLAVLGGGAHRDAPGRELEGGDERGEQHERDDGGSHARLRHREVSEVHDARAPRVADVEHLLADLARRARWPG